MYVAKLDCFAFVGLEFRLTRACFHEAGVFEKDGEHDEED